MRMVAALSIAALVDHIVAAQLNGGGRIAYVHHILGFFLIAAITALPAAAVAHFWPRYRNRAWVVFGFIQLLLGIFVILTELRDR